METRRVAAYRAGAAALAAAVLSGLVVTAGSGGPAGAAARIVVVGAENEYADVASQIGGHDVQAEAIMSNPNTDPHTFEASPAVAREVAGAAVVIQNGVGYDSFMTTIEQADASSSRVVIDVQKLRHLPTSTANPHLWYTPATMPAVAAALAAQLAKLEPAQRSYFEANERRFVASLATWKADIAALKAKHGGAPVATTEPVADYMLQAAGMDNLTPFSLQDDIMNGVDPSPQDVTVQDTLFSGHKVKVFVYNQQVTDTVTDRFLSLAKSNGIPVVGVYETMPEPGYDYQRWMVAEVHALTAALSAGRSSPKL